VRRLSGPAADLFTRPLSPGPAVDLLDVTAPALVLGSTQPPVETSAVPVVRRRSGGGAVLLDPSAVVWADVVLPAGDPLWDADVGRAFLWLGDVWVEALGRFFAGGGPAARRHPGPLVRSPLSDLVCFAGLGPGEVTVEGRKVVGISQRRTREGALFQCAALLRWDFEGVASLLGLPAAAADLADVAAGLPLTRDELERAFLAAIAGV
jgi:lipoate-protein ligase A